MSQMIKPLETAIRPLAEAAGVQLYACRFVVEDGVQSFHVMIEKEGGVTIDTCAELSRTINLMLQVEHPTIPEKYQLMVSSPGIERPLIYLDHYKSVIGQEIKVTLRQQVDGAKRYQGVLLACGDDQITLETPKGAYTLTLSEIAKANVVWTNGAKK